MLFGICGLQYGWDFRLNLFDFFQHFRFQINFVKVSVKRTFYDGRFWLETIQSFNGIYLYNWMLFQTKLNRMCILKIFKGTVVVSLFELSKRDGKNTLYIIGDDVMKVDFCLKHPKPYNDVYVCK